VTYVLWSLAKNGRLMRAELEDHDAGGVDLRILHDGDLTYVQKHYRLDLALYESSWLRREFEAAGWEPQKTASAD
jgi:hypothetical protein